MQTTISRYAPRWFELFSLHASSCCPPPAACTIRTSLGYLSECQTCASLEIDVVGENESAQGPKRLAREEVGFAALGVVNIERDEQGVRGERTFSRYWRRSATASRSLSARTGS